MNNWQNPVVTLHKEIKILGIRYWVVRRRDSISQYLAWQSQNQRGLYTRIERNTDQKNPCSFLSVYTKISLFLRKQQEFHWCALREISDDPNLAKPEPKRVVYTDRKEHRSEKSVFLSIRVYKNFSFLAQKARISLVRLCERFLMTLIWQSHNQRGLYTRIERNTDQKK